MSILAIALLNCLLGVTCGLWFKIQILIPLIAIAFIEVVILKQTGIWSLVFWSAITLITSLEMGYLIGSSLGALRLYSVRRKVLHDFTRHGHTLLHR